MMRALPHRAWPLLRRYATHIDAETEVEKQIAQKVLEALPTAEKIAVRDTSGGCGSMYSLEVIADAFVGKPIYKQHQLVTKALKEDITQWHGFTLQTKAPPVPS